MQTSSVGRMDPPASPISPYTNELPAPDSPGSQALCRICYESETPHNPFCQPCKCRGTSRYVHVSCLQKWRAQHRPDQEAYKRCMECNHKYQTRPGARKTTLYSVVIRFSRHTFSNISLVLLSCILISYLLEKIPGLQSSVDKIGAKIHISDEVDLSFIPSLIWGLVTYGITRYLFHQLTPPDDFAMYRKLKCVANFYFIVFFVINFYIGALAIVGFLYVCLDILMKTFSEEILRRTIPSDEIIDYQPESERVEIVVSDSDT